MPVPVISLKNVYYRYSHAPDGATALSGVTLDVEDGEFVAVVGANGSGKSTLARLLNGLLTPTSGEVRVDGAATTDAADRDRIRETVGLVFQNPESQMVATTVEDDIAFGLENLGLPPEAIERRVDEVAGQFGLADFRKREPHWLSGGQKQCVVLAGVMALKPRVLVLDEPASMLDPGSRHRFRALVDELWNRGTTVVYITNVMEEIAAAPRLLALAGGRVAFDGVPTEFFSSDDLLVRTGIIPPLPVRLSAALAARGRAGETPPPLTLAELVRQVCA